MILTTTNLRSPDRNKTIFERCFIADLFINGELAAEVRSNGNGGAYLYRWTGKYAGHKGFFPPKDVQDWLDSLQPMTYYGKTIKRDLDCMVDETFGMPRTA